MRYSADPFSVYNDGRVQKLYNFIQKFSEVLRSHQEAEWEFLVEKTIEVYEDRDQNSSEEH